MPVLVVNAPERNSSHLTQLQQMPPSVAHRTGQLLFKRWGLRHTCRPQRPNCPKLFTAEHRHQGRFSLALIRLDPSPLECSASNREQLSASLVREAAAGFRFAKTSVRYSEFLNPE